MVKLFARSPDFLNEGVVEDATGVLKINHRKIS